MHNDLEREMVAALEVAPQLVPFVPELLADIWVLGSWPEKIVKMLMPLGLAAETTRVLDLGCGKGSVGIALAREMGFQIRGVDIFNPFLQEARERASGFDVAHLCEFECADIGKTIDRYEGFDVVIYAALGWGVLGGVGECIRKLRQTVRRGGYLVVDDGFLTRPGKIDYPGFEYYLPHEGTLGQLTACGDTVLKEVQVSSDEIRRYDQTCTGLIRKRATKLTAQHPEQADLFACFVDQQERESKILESDITGAIWLLQRTESIRQVGKRRQA